MFASLTKCTEVSKISRDRLYLGVEPSTRHLSLLASYLLNIERGACCVRDMIVADLRGFIDLGAAEWAADTLVVLRMFLAEFPAAGSVAKAATKLKRGEETCRRTSACDSRKMHERRQLPRCKALAHAPMTVKQSW